MIEFENPHIKTCIVKKDGEEMITIPLISSTVTNKFCIIQSFISRLSDFFCSNNEFDDWLEYFLLTYEHDYENRYQIILDNISEIKRFVDEYFEHAGIDFDQFLDESKAKKTTILFTPFEIKEIAKHSGYLKIYSLISNSETLKLDQRLHKHIYNEFLKDISHSDVTMKIFNVIKTKTYKYNFTDKYMWDYISLVQCKSIDLHVIQIFNFIMNSIFILCEETRNPITYFVTVVDESIKWFLRSVYKTSVIYEDSVATENIQGMNVNNLKTYSYNDTIGRLKGISYESLYKQFEDSAVLTVAPKENEKDTELVAFQNRIKDITYISPISEHFMYPILSKATGIPYQHFKTLSPEYSAVISSFMQNIFRNAFKTEYKNIIDLMGYYPTNQPPLATTYKVKDIHNAVNYQNQVNSFFGFNTKILSTNIMSHFVGRVSRITFRNVFNGSKISGTPLNKIESDLVKFYTQYWAGNLSDEIDQINKMINSVF